MNSTINFLMWILNGLKYIGTVRMYRKHCKTCCLQCFELFGTRFIIFNTFSITFNLPNVQHNDKYKHIIDIENKYKLTSQYVNLLDVLRACLLLYQHQDDDSCHVCFPGKDKQFPSFNTKGLKGGDVVNTVYFRFSCRSRNGCCTAEMIFPDIPGCSELRQPSTNKIPVLWKTLSTLTDAIRLRHVLLYVSIRQSTLMKRASSVRDTLDLFSNSVYYLYTYSTHNFIYFN